MDHNFTQQLGEWLNTPDNKKDYRAGNLMLLKLSGNRVMFKQIGRAIDLYKNHIAFNLQRYYNFRVQKLTHQQVQQMQQQVDEIVEREIPLAVNADNAAQDGIGRGRRDDHDALPDDIKAKYEENYAIYHKMRELHMQLRSLSLESATCPDSERYPFLKEIIELDKKLHANWEAYDRYIPQSDEA